MTKKPSSKSISSVVDALNSAQQNRKAHGVAAREAKKSTERTNARAAIYSELSEWVGETVKQGDAIPIYRNGKRLGEFASSFIGRGWEIDQIVEASKLLSAAELRKKRKSLKDLADMTTKLGQSLADLDLMDLLQLDHEPKDFTSDTEIKVVRAIGITSCSLIALNDLHSAFHWQIKELDKKLTKPFENYTHVYAESVPHTAKGRMDYQVTTLRRFGKFLTRWAGRMSHSRPLPKLQFRKSAMRI